MSGLSRKALNFGALEQIEAWIDSAGNQPSIENECSHTPGTDPDQ